jgi:hypothetical protein
VPGIKGKVNAQTPRALDPGPWPLKKTPYPVIIEKGAARKGQGAAGYAARAKTTRLSPGQHDSFQPSL